MYCNNQYRKLHWRRRQRVDLELQLKSLDKVCHHFVYQYLETYVFNVDLLYVLYGGLSDIEECISYSEHALQMVLTSFDIYRRYIVPCLDTLIT